MRLNIFVKEMELTDSMESHLNAQLDKLGTLEDFVGETHLDVTFRVNKHNHVCEGQIRVQKKDVFAKAVSSDMYKSIDDMVESLKTQILKIKNKAQKHKSKDITIESDDITLD